MTTPHASDLLETPVRTDADVLARVATILDSDARRQRSLWLFFIDSDGMQSNVVVPIDDVPERPDLVFAHNLGFVAAHAIADAAPGGQTVITLARPGPAELAEADRLWLAALREGVTLHDAPVRMYCLATPDTVRELGPVGLPSNLMATMCT
jgi:hypothetical protein